MWTKISNPAKRQSHDRRSSLSFDCLEERLLLAGRCSRDDYPNSYSSASLISLETDGSGTQYGVIECKRDTDMFRFVAPVSGQLTVDHSASPGSRLDSALWLTDESWQYIPDQYVSSTRKVIEVTVGATYFVGTYGFGKSKGAYQLSFRTDAGSDGGSGGTGPLTLTLTGTEGADVYTLGAGGTGLKSLVYNGTSLDLEAHFGHDTFIRFNRVVANMLGGDDQLIIDPSVLLPAVIDGGNGNDSLTGGSGNDTIRGSQGGDLLIGSVGNDVIEAGLDSDSLSGLAGGNTMLGGDGNDSLVGGNLNDLLDGGAGNDTLTGGAGTDFLDGGDGTNTLTGGSGADTWAIIGTETADTILVQSALNTGSKTTNGVVARQDRFTDVYSFEDRLFLTGFGGDDSITQTGATPVEIWGGDGNDFLQGGTGNDFIDGGLGNDQLLGMAGSDNLFGYSGDDVVDGGDGNDTLIGSGGTDVIRPGSGSNQVLLSGLDNSSATASLAAARAYGASGLQLSFTRTVTIPGSVRGFNGSATATVTVNGSLDSNGNVSGSLSASGSASGSGFGCTASGTFTASGSASGPLSAVAWNVSYSGSGTVSCNNGYQFSGGLSGGYSGVVSLVNGTGNQSLTASSSGGMTGSASIQIPEFRSSSLIQDGIGRAPNSCTVQSATAERSARRGGCGTRDVTFDPGPWQPGETDRVLSILPLIKDENQRDWIANKVHFSRGGDGFCISTSPGLLKLNNCFFSTNDTYTDVDQANDLIFELGRAFWFENINAGPYGTRTPRQQAFEHFYFQHQGTIDAMKFAQLNGRDLSRLQDNDPQAWFSYAYRVTVLNLDPPENNPKPSFWSAAKWEQIKKDWVVLRDQVFKPYLDQLQSW